MGNTLITPLSVVAGLLLFWFLSLTGLPHWACVLGGGVIAVMVLMVPIATCRMSRHSEEEGSKKEEQE